MLPGELLACGDSTCERGAMEAAHSNTVFLNILVNAASFEKFPDKATCSKSLAYMIKHENVCLFLVLF